MCVCVQQKLKTDEYRSVHDFLHHVRLLLENARSFFGEGSEEVACVDQLETRFTQRLQEYAGHFTHSSGEGEWEWRLALGYISEVNSI